MDSAQQSDFQRVARARRLRHLVLRKLQQLEDARELRGVVLRRLLRQRTDLVIGKILLHSRKRRQSQVAGLGGELFGEALHVRALFVCANHAAHRRRGIAREHGGDDVAHHRGVQSAERLRRFLVPDLFGSGIVRGEELIEQRQGVAHGPLRLSRHHRHRAVGDPEVLGLRDLAQPRDDLSQRHELDVLPLHPGKDRGRKFLRIGGRKQELDVAGRLLERLEQGIERRAREHVHFVDDVDLVAVAGRQVLRRLAQRAHVVDAVVRGGVDLLDVDVVAGGDLHARAADAARFGGGAFLAIERPGEDPRGRRLPAAARAGEEEGMRHPAALQGVDQGPDDVLLPRQILEALRPVLSSEDEVRSGHRRFKFPELPGRSTGDRAHG